MVDLGSQNGAQNFGPQGPFGLLFGVQKCCSFLSCFGSPLRRPKRAQKAPKTPRGAPQSALRWPKRSPKALQEAPRGPQETPRAVPEGSKPAQELPIASQDAREAFPKHLARQPCSDNSKNSNLGANKQRRGFRSPTSMNSKGLASNCRKKKGGRAAVIPLGEVNPPPPEGSERVQIVFEKFFEFFEFKRVQPGPAHSSRRPELISKIGP